MYNIYFSILPSRRGSRMYKITLFLQDLQIQTELILTQMLAVLLGSQIGVVLDVLSEEGNVGEAEHKCHLADGILRVAQIIAHVFQHIFLYPLHSCLATYLLANQ